MHRTTTAGHHVLVCEHGYPVQQCRCPAPRGSVKPLVYENDDCRRRHPTAIAPEHEPRPRSPRPDAT